MKKYCPLFLILLIGLFSSCGPFAGNGVFNAGTFQNGSDKLHAVIITLECNGTSPEIFTKEILSLSEDLKSVTTGGSTIASYSYKFVVKDFNTGSVISELGNVTTRTTAISLPVGRYNIFAELWNTANPANPFKAYDLGHTAAVVTVDEPVIQVVLPVTPAVNEGSGIGKVYLKGEIRSASLITSWEIDDEDLNLTYDPSTDEFDITDNSINGISSGARNVTLTFKNAKGGSFKYQEVINVFEGFVTDSWCGNSAFIKNQGGKNVFNVSIEQFEMINDQQIIYVDPENPASSDSGSGTWLTPYKTLSAAQARFDILKLSRTDITIKIKGNLNLSDDFNKSTYKASYIFTQDPERQLNLNIESDSGSIITASGLETIPVFYFGNSSNTVLHSYVLKNITVTNNMSAAIKIEGNSNSLVNKIVLDNCVIEHNTSNNGVSPGGVYSAFADIELNGCRINNNYGSGNGAGIACYGGKFTCKNSRIYENTSDYIGGGVLLSYASSYGNAVFDNTLIYDNKAVQFGAGIYAVSDSDDVTNIELKNHTVVGAAEGITVCATSESKSNYLSGNTGIKGAGIYITGGTTVKAQLIIDETSSVSYNLAGVSGPSGYGAGIYGHFCEMTIKGKVQYNSGKVDGGGIFAEENSEITVLNNGCVNNNNILYTDCLGGGIAVKNSTVTLNDNAAVEYNKAFCGGGIYCRTTSAAGVTATVNMNDSSSVSYNEVSGLEGAGILFSEETNKSNYLKMNGGRVTYNKFTTAAQNVSGAGVMASPYTFITLRGSSYIGHNQAVTTGEVKGYGIYLINNSYSACVIYDSTVVDVDNDIYFAGFASSNPNIIVVGSALTPGNNNAAGNPSYTAKVRFVELSGGVYNTGKNFIQTGFAQFTSYVLTEQDVAKFCIAKASSEDIPGSTQLTVSQKYIPVPYGNGYARIKETGIGGFEPSLDDRRYSLTANPGTVVRGNSFTLQIQDLSTNDTADISEASLTWKLMQNGTEIGSSGTGYTVTVPDWIMAGDYQVKINFINAGGFNVGMTADFVVTEE